jgi:filamentous hemagglutinin family protein
MQMLRWRWSLWMVCLAFACPAQAQVVPNGLGTQVTVNGQQFDITGGTRAGANLFHSFAKFGLSQAQIAHFLSNPAIRNILARVTGGEVSVINGLIKVTGGNSNLYLMNPAGIVFGQGASLNVPASFRATTADRIMFPGGSFNAVGVNDYSKLAGEPIGFAFDRKDPAAIVNEGNLTVNPGQSVSLIAGQVMNTGTIQAPGGNITLAAVPGENLVRLSQAGQLLSLEFNPQQAAQMMDGEGNIPTTRLPELLTGGGVTTVTQNSNGTVRVAGSNVQIPTSTGTTIVSGALDVSSASQMGGNVGVFGTQIALVNSEINASGFTGGGEILIGGEFQGKGTQPNAQYTFVSYDSQLTADAVNAGNGGRVIVWADKGTDFRGRITAKGGQNGGDGGLVEVSGKESLRFTGNVDTSAPKGKTGTLLLDPVNITVNITLIDAFSAPDDNRLPLILFLAIPGRDAFISNTALVSQLSTNNVVLRAANDITFNGEIVGTFGDTTLSIDAGNNITISNQISGSGLNLSFSADNTINANALISLSDGEVSFRAGNGISTGDIVATEGIALTSDGSINTGDLQSSFGNVSVVSEVGNIQTGDITASLDVLVGNTGSTSGNVKSGNITSALGNVSVVSEVGNIQTGDITASLDVLIGSTGSTSGTIQTGNLTSELGDINVASIASDIVTGNLTSDLGKVSVVSESGNIETGDITASLDALVGSTGSTSGNVKSGNITSALGNVNIISEFGNIQTGDIITLLGDVFIVSTSGNIRTGNIATLLGSIGIATFGEASSINTAELLSLAGVVLIVNEFGNIQTGDITSEGIFLGAGGNINTGSLESFSGDGLLVIDSGTIQTPQEGTTSIVPFGGEIRTALGSGDFAAILPLDTLFTKEFDRFLGVSPINNLNSVEAIGNMLSRLAKETGKKTAIVYLVVDEQQLTIAAIPPGSRAGVARAGLVASTEPFAQQEAKVQPVVRGIPEAKRANLMPVVERFLNALRDPRQRTSDAYLKDAQQLYQWFIAPIEKELQAQGIDTLLFSMDNGLRLLPVAALHDGQQFLVEKYSTALIPSVNLIDTRYRNLRDSRVLAMGADTFANQAPLPAVPVELKVITEEWPGQSFLNQEFTVQRLTQERLQGGYPIIHLATHADFAPGRITNSYIEFGNNQRLNLPQVRELPLREPNVVELLTLSACRTSVGDVSAELGFAGLAVQAGVKSALASLWYVSDEGTLALMTEFYKNLRQAPIKAEALRQAQIAMLRGKVTIKGGELRGVRGGIPVPSAIAQRGDQVLNHPYYWAAFTLIGSPW